MTTSNILIIITSIIAALLEIIDSSIVNVAVPTMMGNLGVTLDEISWVSTGYMIANSIVLPIAAWFGSRLGRRRYYTGAIFLFTLASMACGLAPNLATLVIFRLIQGFAGGALLPTSQTLIQEQFPKEKATLAMGIFGMSIMIGPALGPVLGGYLTDNFGWRSIFNINIPLGILAGILSYLYVDADKKPAKGSAGSAAKSPASQQSVDWGGFALLTLGVGSFQYILERGQEDGWFDSKAITLMAILAVVGLVGFVFWELRVKNPIMNLRLFKNNVVSMGSVLMLALGIIIYSLTFVVPIFVNNIIHLTATQTGMLFIPGSIATSIMMASVDPIAKRFHPRAIILSGVAICAFAVFLLSQSTTSTGSHDLFWPLIVRGMGMAFLFISVMSVVNGPFRGQELEQVSGMMNFFRQMGGSIGIASLSTLLTRFGKQNYVDLMPRMTMLSEKGYHDFAQTAASMATSTASKNLGMTLPQSVAMKSLWGRVMGQSFIMSFNQLCWVIMAIVIAMAIPVFLMKMPRRVSANVNSH